MMNISRILLHFINRTLLLALFSTCFSMFSAAQNLQLNIVQKDSAKFFIKKKNYQTNFADTLLLQKELQQILNSLNSKGYLSARFDSIKTDSTSVTAWLRTGNIYKWGSISINQVEKNAILKNRIKINDFENKAIDYNKLNQLQEDLLIYYENNGYPFAETFLDSIVINDSTIKANLVVRKNKLIKLDSIIVKGNARITKRYLENYLNIKQGEIYNETKIKLIGNRLKEIPFITEIKPFEVNFEDKRNNIFLYLNSKKANQFNGMVGFLPNNKKTGKLLITGELNLLLLNSFGKGELIKLDWERLEEETQSLNLQADYPYLFSSPFGIDINFKLLKKDTTYLTTDINAGIQYLMQGGNFIKVFVQNKNSSLVSTYNLQASTVLPNYADVNSLLYGIGYKNEMYDYKFNPRKGYGIIFNVAAGNKTIKKNRKIPEQLYNNIDLKTIQAEGEITLTYYQPILRSMTIKIENKSGYIENSNLFDNELFKLGGMKTLRGFDEQTILASAFSIFTLEYKFLFERNSNFYIFTDGGYYEKDTQGKLISDTPYGFGLGMDFETKAGIFSISYALGKQFDNPVEIKSAKIHFGYISRF